MSKKQSFHERMRESYRKDWEAARSELDKLKDNWPAGLVLLLIIVGIVAIVRWEGPPARERYCDNTDRASSWAAATAQSHVEKLLNDPDSAVFPLEPHSVSRLGECRFMVIGTVRARNGFGGYVTNTYVVRTEYDLSISRTRVELLSME
ncbi:hypothetical protein [Thioclava sp.]|uniref:hypothetical protein n=1 Tax=Thioclava sp. TaxID=1933450 RepID=UPI003AA850F4